MTIKISTTKVELHGILFNCMIQATLRKKSDSSVIDTYTSDVFNV